jgi:hypothetical protein
MRKEHEARIESWMAEVVKDGGLERYDDLHIDQVDSQWANREQWLRAGLEAYRIAVGLRESHKFNLVVVLAFSLESGESRKGLNFTTLDGLQAELDWSPPSLYLFRPERVPWAPDGGAEVIPVDPGALFDMPGAKGCFYLEFKQPESAEYSRSVLLAG